MDLWALILADLLLAAGFTARLTRLIVTDDLGLWWVRHPAMRWADRHDRSLPVIPPGGYLATEERVWVPGWRSKLTLGLSCPYCVGWWLGCAVLLSLWLVGGPGHAAEAWRYIAGTFTLNYVAAHIGSRLGDVADDE